MGVGIRFHDEGLHWVSGLGLGFGRGSEFSFKVGVRLRDIGRDRVLKRGSGLGFRMEVGSGFGTRVGVQFWNRVPAWGRFSESRLDFRVRIGFRDWVSGLELGFRIRVRIEFRDWSRG